MEITDTIHHELARVEISDTLNGFAHRIVNTVTDEEGQWCRYEFMATVPYRDGKVWAHVTDSWAGILPTDILLCIEAVS